MIKTGRRRRQKVAKHEMDIPIKNLHYGLVRIDFVVAL
jgi:hypothetical protein